MKKKFIIITCLTCLLLLAAAISAVFFVPYSSQFNTVLIPVNTSFVEVLDSLATKKSRMAVFTFALSARLTGNAENIKSGRYELKNEGNIFLLRRLKKGRQQPVNLIFNNIRTKEQLCNRLAEQLMLAVDELKALLDDEQFHSQYNLNPDNVVSIFIPNTYEVYWTISAEKLFERMYVEYTAFWTESRLAQAEKIGLTPTEVSILASIVEEESNLSGEKPRIAGLYINRLRSKLNLLQADPTIKFALQDFNIKRILKEHINRSADSPYNTYTHKGLPPGPIRIPSVSSIEAVLHYEHNPYYFMCAKSDGEPGHDFAVSYNEHLKNSAHYHRMLNKLNIK